MTTTNTSVIKKLLLIFLIIADLYFAKEFLIPLFIGGILLCGHGYGESTSNWTDIVEVVIE